MKALLTLAALALTSNAFASTAKVPPTTDTLKPSTIEHVFYVQKESATQPAIRFVQVGNGGSTDISSAMNPSRLYVAIHQNGEMFDIDGSYLVSEGVADLRVLKFEKGVVTINYSSHDERMKEIKHTALINLNAPLKEAANATSNFDDFTMKSSVEVQEL